MGIIEKMRLDGKSIYVTGAASGIGRCAAMAFAEAGADVAIVDKEKVERTKQKMISDTEIYNISDFFKIFGDSTRLKIIYALENNPLCVGDLCNVLDITKSAASHQLNILRTNKIVKFQKKGKNVIYMLDDEHVSLIIETARNHLNEGNR